MNQIEEIDSEIKELKKKKNEMKMQEKVNNKQIRNERKTNSNGNSNEISRISYSLARKMDHINNKREANGLPRLSNPKITDLIIKHKVCWSQIETDLIKEKIFNTSGIKNEEKN